MKIYSQIVSEMKSLANKEQGQNLSRFFKTGPGQYGEGDIFLGIKVPVQRQIAKKYKDASLADIEKLLASPIHEHRLVGLLILVFQYEKADDVRQEEIAKFYLKNLSAVNNWDLVDLSTPKILGHYFFHQLPKRLSTEVCQTINNLADSNNLWQRRVAMVSTFYSIYQGRHQEAIMIAKKLLNDKHDLIHKAVGWMLREMGKRAGREHLLAFLDKNLAKIPRTALRYAVEHLPETQRQAYLRKK